MVPFPSPIISTFLLSFPFSTLCVNEISGVVAIYCGSTLSQTLLSPCSSSHVVIYTLTLAEHMKCSINILTLSLIINIYQHESYTKCLWKYITIQAE